MGDFAGHPFRGNQWTVEVHSWTGSGYTPRSTHASEADARRATSYADSLGVRITSPAGEVIQISGRPAPPPPPPEPSKPTKGDLERFTERYGPRAQEILDLEDKAFYEFDAVKRDQLEKQVDALKARSKAERDAASSSAPDLAHLAKENKIPASVGSTAGRVMPELPSHFSPERNVDAGAAWDKIGSASTPAELTRAVRAVTRDADAGKIKVSDGVIAHLKATASATIRSRSGGPQRSGADIRADAILKVRDSSGKVRGRKW